MCTTPTILLAGCFIWAMVGDAVLKVSPKSSKQLRPEGPATTLTITTAPAVPVWAVGRPQPFLETAGRSESRCSRHPGPGAQKSKRGKRQRSADKNW